MTTITTLAPPIPGLLLMPLDIGKVLDELHWCEAHGVSYGLGAKPTEHDNPQFGPVFDYPPVFPSGECDCSGFSRLILYHGTAGAVLMPDGSANQNDWCSSEGYKRSNYANCLLKDGRVRIAFCRHEDGHAYGHVWLCYMGYTIECFGGNGPGSRSVNTPVLERIVSDVYVIA